MWHEGIAGRGANEINSCLYEYITSSSSDCSRLITFSDNCAAQNKSKHTVVMFLYSLSHSSKIEEIEHYYLEKGHTQNENDSVHSVIEHASRNIPIFTPQQWYSVVQSAWRVMPYTVVEMTGSRFYDFKDLSRKFRNFSMAENGEKVQWHKICRFKFLKGESHVAYFSYGYDDDYNALDLLRKYQGLNCQRNRCSASSCHS